MNTSYTPWPDVVGALAPLTRLAELGLDFPRFRAATVPDTLGQLKGLRSLLLYNMQPCVLEAGCLDLPLLKEVGILML